MTDVRADILEGMYELKIESSERKRPTARMVMSGHELKHRLIYDVDALVRQAYRKAGNKCQETAELKLTVRALSRREFLFGK